jgi:hypothetical protein
MTQAQSHLSAGQDGQTAPSLQAMQARAHVRQARFSGAQPASAGMDSNPPGPSLDAATRDHDSPAENAGPHW